jgi:hypothetical protein
MGADGGAAAALANFVAAAEGSCTNRLLYCRESRGIQREYDRMGLGSRTRKLRSSTGYVYISVRREHAKCTHLTRILGLLSTKPFNGRPTFADGRNAVEEIPIKRLVGVAGMQVPSPRSPRTPRTTPPVMQYPSSTPPMMSPMVSDYSQVSSLT